MKNKYNLVSVFFAAIVTLMVSGMIVVVRPERTYAITCPDGSFLPDAEADMCPAAGSDGDGVDRDEINKDQCTDPELTNDDNCLILKYLVNGINFLSAAAGLVLIFSLMWAGYTYMTARDNSGQIQQARTRIIWTIIALGIFVFSYAILDFLVPGGVLP